MYSERENDPRLFHGKKIFSTASLRAMNPRRVHELMKEHFSSIDTAARTWINLLERDGSVRTDRLTALIDAHIQADDLLIEVHRKLGDFLEKEQALKFISEHIGQGEIRIADRSFQGFVVVAINGAATGWSRSLDASLHADAQARQ